jgi:hypothetical protein
MAYNCQYDILICPKQSYQDINLFQHASPPDPSEFSDHISAEVPLKMSASSKDLARNFPHLTMCQDAIVVTPGLEIEAPTGLAPLLDAALLEKFGYPRLAFLRCIRTNEVVRNNKRA